MAPKDPFAGRSDDVLLKACNSPDGAEECMAMVGRLATNKDQKTKANVFLYRERAFAEWDRACEAHYFEACMHLRDGFSQGGWEPVINKRLVDVADWVCELHHVPEACDMLFRGWSNGRFGNDPAKARRYGAILNPNVEPLLPSTNAEMPRIDTPSLRDRCDTENAEACRTLAERYLGNGPDAHHSPRDAAFLLDHACDLGDGLACEELAEMYRNGHDVPRDARRADDLSARARWLRNEP